MAYLDPKPMSPARIWSIVVVLALHAVLLYFMATGGYSVVKEKLEEMKVIDVKEAPPPPPEELPPPPPPEQNLPPPPVVTPPPIVRTPPINQPQIQTQPNPPPVFNPTPAPPTPAPPPPPPAPPPPPEPPKVATRATLRSGSISDEDYPPAAVRAEEQGRSVATYTIGTDGRVSSCNASGAGPILDAETCKLIQRRFRFKAAADTSGSPVAETKTQSIVWRLPK